MRAIHKQLFLPAHGTPYDQPKSLTLFQLLLTVILNKK